MCYPLFLASGCWEYGLWSVELIRFIFLNFHSGYKVRPTFLARIFSLAHLSVVTACHTHRIGGMRYRTYPGRVLE